MSGPEELVPQRVRTPESNTLCRVRSITPLKPRSKRVVCLPKYTAEVQRIHASAQGADWSSLAVWGRVATSRYAHDADEEARAPLSLKAQPLRKA